MGEIENQSIIIIFTVIIGILSLLFRTIYYYFVFCSPYILKSYSHLVDDTETVNIFLQKRQEYIYLVLLLFILFLLVFFSSSLYFFSNKIVVAFLLIFGYLAAWVFIDTVVKDILFIRINRFLRFLDVVFGFMKIFSFLIPLSKILGNFVNLVLRIFEQDIDLSKKYFAEAIVFLDDFNWDDYRMEIIEKFLSIDDTLVREIMVPRVDIVALESNKIISEISSVVMKYGYSKYPVYEESIDNIIGVVFLKDILKYVLTNQGYIRLKDIARIPLIVPESKNVYELLEIMKQNRSSIAIVVDEYGGTSGIVTITDLIQELLGKIHDEHDKEIEEENIQKISDFEYVVNPKIDIYTLEEFLGFEFPDKDEREYTTLSGLIYTKLGRIPQEGEIINIDNIVLKILEIKKNRINKVLIRME